MGGEVLAVGVLVSVWIALLVSPVPQPALRAELPKDLELPYLLARDEEPFELYGGNAEGLSTSRSRLPGHWLGKIEELICRLTNGQCSSLSRNVWFNNLQWRA